uniref:Uncharacterized protein ORF115_2 n=1 Tax=Nothoceros aenigmaticus TaxID=13813 RepID=C3RYP4_9EMBR|nr:hypothetical protein MeaeMp41 [Nothoceros aenigmaticus]ACC86800.1 hypothetical protein MeaeMp41 [Nothoceros aenigmaticus]
MRPGWGGRGLSIHPGEEVLITGLDCSLALQKKVAPLERPYLINPQCAHVLLWPLCVSSCHFFNLLRMAEIRQKDSEAVQATAAQRDAGQTRTAAAENDDSAHVGKDYYFSLSRSL